MAHVTAGIREDSGFPDVIVLVLVDVTMDPKSRLMRENQGFEIGGEGSTEMVQPEFIRY